MHSPRTAPAAQGFATTVALRSANRLQICAWVHVRAAQGARGEHGHFKPGYFKPGFWCLRYSRTPLRASCPPPLTHEMRARALADSHLAVFAWRDFAWAVTPTRHYLPPRAAHHVARPTPPHPALLGHARVPTACMASFGGWRDDHLEPAVGMRSPRQRQRVQPRVPGAPGLRWASHASHPNPQVWWRRRYLTGAHPHPPLPPLSQLFPLPPPFCALGTAFPLLWLQVSSLDVPDWAFVNSVRTMLACALPATYSRT
jgi:hypothetical protein